MNIKKVLSSMVAVLALGATSFITIVPTASAGNPFCPRGKACLWSQTRMTAGGLLTKIQVQRFILQ
ncbi:hypothetical protein JTE88_03005 [Arcanobacterium phocisimile]|uniref:Peptidase inhibitor family I36 n=1 Tax=Arcanobacterium phocisimile TaxID=1302235 RepID=A0ABX7IHW3_9ACTO|nr:hypothetical protein [Arcanobacterium phocisimile]QRV02721.1 hypothetical protein JTE88_03005 [Arcanobacterium phocisimile]